MGHLRLLIFGAKKEEEEAEQDGMTGSEAVGDRVEGAVTGVMGAAVQLLLSPQLLLLQLSFKRMCRKTSNRLVPCRSSDKDYTSKDNPKAIIVGPTKAIPILLKPR